MTKAISPPRRTRKKGPKPRYPHGLELEYQRAYRKLWGRFRDLVNSDAFTAKLQRLLTKYQVNVTDGIDDELDDVLTGIEVGEALVPDALLEQIAGAYARRVQDWNEAEAARSIEGVRGISVNLSEQSLMVQRETFVARNVRLIRGVAEEQRKRIADAILEGIQAGRGIGDIQDAIGAAVDIGENRARLIARDQVASYNGSLTEERMLANGVDKFIWSTSLDERVRASHAELEGQVFEWANPPIVDGEEATPGIPVNCRCVAITVIE